MVRLVVSVLMLLGVVMPASAAAQGVATPRPLPARLDLDLPAMTLVAEEYPVAGLTLYQGNLYFLEDLADSWGPSAESDDYLAYLDEIGWETMYVSQSLRARPEDAHRTGISAQSYVTVYGDADGAGDGFRYFGGGGSEMDAPVVGDQSQLFVKRGYEQGTPYIEMDYMFRTDRLVAGVILTWYDGDEADLIPAEDIAGSAATLLDRINAGVAAADAGLFGGQLRITAPAGFSRDLPIEYYVLLDGKRGHIYGGAMEIKPAFTRELEAAGAQNIYYAMTSVYPEDDWTGWTTVILRTYEFDTAEHASAGADIIARRTVSGSADAGYSSMTPLSVLPDGLAAGFEFSLPHYDGQRSSGYLLIAQDGPMVTTIRVERPDGVDDLDSLLPILEAQRACSASQRACGSLEMPGELLDPRART